MASDRLRDYDDNGNCGKGGDGGDEHLADVGKPIALDCARAARPKIDCAAAAAVAHALLQH